MTFLDDLPASHATRNIYSAFPIPHISAGVQVEILEPNYRRRAASELVGRSILGINHHKTRVNASQARADLQFSEEELQQRRERVAELDDVVEFGQSSSRLDRRTRRSVRNELTLYLLPFVRRHAACAVLGLLPDVPSFGSLHGRTRSDTQAHPLRPSRTC